jgi:PEP-CTERM motif
MKSKFALLVSTLALILPLSSAAALVQVKALENSTTGGVGVSAPSFTIGDLFTISVNPNDLWSAGAIPRWSNANGLTGPDLITDGGFDLPSGISQDAIPSGTIGPGNFGNWTQGGLSAPFGSLVGAWGNAPNTFFFIGTNFDGTALDSVLNLYFFDSFAPDNTGSILADINITAVPEPEIFALMLTGLGIVGFSGRNRKIQKA